MLANFLQRLPGTRIAKSLRQTEIRKSRVRRAMANIANIRAIRAADSQRPRNVIRHLEERRAVPPTGDLARAAIRTLRTTWRKPRVWRRPAAIMLVDYPLHYPEGMEESR